MARYSGRDQELRGGNTWHADVPTRIPHLCFPPKAYPQGIGPGTPWRCPRTDCHHVWWSYGIQVIGDWPHSMDPNKGYVLCGPEYWLPDAATPGLKTADGVTQETLMYDFRNPLDLILEELRRR